MGILDMYDESTNELPQKMKCKENDLAFEIFFKTKAFMETKYG
jgi:hypothetical protein